MSDQQTFDRVETALPGVCLLQPRVWDDPRGPFWESYHEAKLAALGIADRFIQDNQSSSLKHVLRGLHYQLLRPQAKLCRVVAGEALDVVVDVRLGSPHFGKWISAVLSEKSRNMIYIPEGFAHGFLALSDKVEFLYKCSALYDPQDAYGIFWGDPALGIDWGISNPILSAKDSEYPPLAKMPAHFLPKYPGT